jgi:hypothetical protein
MGWPSTFATKSRSDAFFRWQEVRIAKPASCMMIANAVAPRKNVWFVMPVL